MKARAKFPLMAKVGVWLAIHLAVLAAAFAGFLHWQLSLGLDSLLSGAAEGRLRNFGQALGAELSATPESGWPELLARRLEPFHVTAELRLARGRGVGRPMVDEIRTVPPPVARRLREEGRPPGPPGPPDGPPGFEDAPPLPPRREAVTRALFLTKEAGAYWAGLAIPLADDRRGPPRIALLLLRSPDAMAGGLFFDYRPWLWGGLAVLAVSLVWWAPFVIGITRYVRRLSLATGRIAEGRFETKIGARRRDELGLLGGAIEEMAARLGDHAARHKRFMADVAHELCAPVARMRTGLGVLEHHLTGPQQGRLASIEEDAAELSALLEELLEFTRAETTAVKPVALDLAALVAEAAGREDVAPEIHSAPGLAVAGDRRLLLRALANLLRNCRRHAGADCRIRVSATAAGGEVTVSVEDDGPGVPEQETERLFEPFYRPDRARTREAGGSGLGLSIVESSVKACGGAVTARRGEWGGLRVELRLRQAGAQDLRPSS